MKIYGYGAVFYNPRDPGTEYYLGSTIRERIAPGAFDRVLASSDEVKSYFNHDMNYSLGSRVNGTLKIWKDSRGLKYEIDYDESDPDHVKVLAKIRRGDLRGSSFSFSTRQESVTRDGQQLIRVIEDLKLHEVGPVDMPAYISTTAGIRSLAKYGSVRWAIETDPQAVKEFDQRQARLKEIERQQVIDRLFELELTR